MDIEQERRSFEDYGLSRTLLQGISEKGWKVPSPVQEGTLEAALKGKYCLKFCFNFGFRSRCFGSCKRRCWRVFNSMHSKN